jgi:hypothetical protein
MYVSLNVRWCRTTVHSSTAQMLGFFCMASKYAALTAAAESAGRLQTCIGFLLHMTRDFVVYAFLLAYGSVTVVSTAGCVQTTYLPSQTHLRGLCVVGYWWAGFLSAATSNTYNLKHPTILHRSA